MNPHLFRAYDIRGNGDIDLTDETAEKIGHALGQIVIEKRGANPRVGVGRDARLSSPRIWEKIAQGLANEGITIVDLGLTTTPLVYFAAHHFELDASFQITASHNPKEDNGIKLMIGKSTLFGDDIQEIYKRALKVELQNPLSKKMEQKQEELREAYFLFLKKSFNFSKKFKVCFDNANGMVGSVARKIFQDYCSEFEIMFEEVDCTFPNHEADPTVLENLRPLQARVKEGGYEVGFSYDGDGDRLGLVTKSGRVLFGDEILMLLSEKVLRDSPGSTIIGEVKCSEKLFNMIENRGGKPLMYRTGHSLIKSKMKEVNSPLAGEMSGHLFFADRYFGFDDAVYATLRVLEVMDELKLDLDEWINTYPRYVTTPEIRVAVSEDEKPTLVDRVIQYFEGGEGVQLNKIDGVRVSFRDGSWALVRASNTQAVLVVRIEAASERRLEEIKTLVKDALDREF